MDGVPNPMIGAHQSPPDPAHDLVDIPKDLLIRESQKSKSAFFQIILSLQIHCLRLSRLMGISIRFNRKFQFVAVKVNDIVIYAKLAAELYSELFFPNISP